MKVSGQSTTTMIISIVKLLLAAGNELTSLMMTDSVLEYLNNTNNNYISAMPPTQLSSASLQVAESETKH